VFLSRKARGNVWKPTLSRHLQTMKAVKKIRWEYAKITHDMYEDIVVNEEIEFFERDKDFLLRCPRIKHSLLHK